MISSHTNVFLDICNQQGYNATHTLSLLLIIKKLYVHYGIALSKPDMMQVVLDSNIDIGTMLAITTSFGYTSGNQIDTLITKVQRLGSDLVCNVESPHDLQEDLITQQLTAHDQKPTILLETSLQKPGLHVVTPTHRYHRDLESDLDSILQ